MGDSLENTDTSVDPGVNVSIANYDAFANYLRKAVTILLPDDDVVPVSLNAALDDPINQETIRKFLSDPQVQALYVQRNCIKGMVQFLCLAGKHASTKWRLLGDKENS